MHVRKISLLISVLLISLLSACGATTAAIDGLSVVATTTIVGDVVSKIGGENINLVVLLPLATDPHGFQPTPEDLVAVANADIVFINGLGLEEFLADMVGSVGGEEKLVSVSDGIDTMEFGGEHDDEEEEGHEEGGADPHVWMDPNNVKVWAGNIATALSAGDPDNAAVYAANAEAYKNELETLDTWAQAEIAALSTAQRTFVTDHDSFGYFASHYGFEIIGTIIPGSSTLSEPSAAELAALEDALSGLDVAAIFVGTTVNPNLAQRVAEDTGVQLVPVYTGSLSDADGPAATYLEMMRYNVETIVAALK